MAGSKKMLQDFEKYPKYKQAYLKAFEKMIENHPGSIRILDERVDISDLGAGGVLSWWIWVSNSGAPRWETLPENLRCRVHPRLVDQDA